jgi:hypothetical protein
LSQVSSLSFLYIFCSVADPHHLDADPDPVFHFDADPDADPDPTFKFDADPSGSGQFFSYVAHFLYDSHIEEYF